MYHTKNILRAALGCAAALLLVTTSAWANNAKCQKSYRLGGALAVTVPVKQMDGSTHIAKLTVLQIPLDVLGRRSATRFEFLSLGPDFEALQELLGISISEAVGHTEMTGRDTAQFTCVAYGVSKSDPKEVRLILTFRAQLRFETAERIRVQDNVTFYLTNSGLDLVAPVMPGGIAWPYGDADADHDLLPDAGAIPFNQVRTEWGLGKIIPMLPLP